MDLRAYLPDGTLLNASDGSVNFTVTAGGSFKIFVSDYNNSLFNTAQGATRTARFANSGTAEYYHEDGLGSVVAITNQAGTVTGSVRYDAWGKAIPVNGTTPPLYGYTGREPDETGLIYYRARYYDPTIGRFIQRDPIGLQGGINLYAYVQNNPINFVDPTGLFAFDPKNNLIATNNTAYFNTQPSLPRSPDETSTPQLGLTSGYESLGGMQGGGRLDVFGPTPLPNELGQTLIPEPSNPIQLAGAGNSTGTITDAGPTATGGITVSLGLTVTGGLGVGGGGGTFLNFGLSREAGFTLSVTGTAEAGGVAGSAWGIQGVFQVTNLSSVQQLTGPFLSVGKSFGAGVTGGADALLTQTGNVIGFDVFLGKGFRFGSSITSPIVTTGFESTTSTIFGFSSRKGFFGPTP